MTNFQDMAQAAEAAMRGVFPETPLQKNEHLSALYDADIWLKREDLSPVRSYKLRGAFNAMRKVAGETHLFAPVRETMRRVWRICAAI